MSDTEHLRAPLESRWAKYTVEQLISSSNQFSRASKRVALLRLVLSAAASGVLLLADLWPAAIIAAILGTVFALLPPLSELVFQAKLTAGGVGMLVEELRALHVQYQLRSETPPGTSDETDGADDAGELEDFADLED